MIDAPDAGKHRNAIPGYRIGFRFSGQVHALFDMIDQEFSQTTEQEHEDSEQLGEALNDYRRQVRTDTQQGAGLNC